MSPHRLLFAGIWGLIAVVLIWTVAGTNGLLDLYDLRKLEKAETAKVSRLLETRRNRYREIRRLRTDAAYIQAVAGKQLGLVPKDAVVYRFEEGDE